MTEEEAQRCKLWADVVVTVAGKLAARPETVGRPKGRPDPTLDRVYNRDLMGEVCADADRVLAEYDKRFHPEQVWPTTGA